MKKAGVIIWHHHGDLDTKEDIAFLWALEFCLLLLEAQVVGALTSSPPAAIPMSRRGNTRLRMAIPGLAPQTTGDVETASYLARPMVRHSGT
ncbi:hypothetical protein VTI74DRAFT_2838 [Chaetomium olivicolor]